MTHNEDLLERLKRANPVPDSGRIYPDPEESRRFSFLVEQRRKQMDDTQVRPIKSREEPPRSRRGVLVAMAALVIVVGVGIGIVLLTGGDEGSDVAGVPALTTAEALVVNDAFFEAFNTGDDDAVLALFTPDVTIDNSYVGRWALADWEMSLAWETAQGTSLTSPDCVVAEELPGETVTVTCETGTHTAAGQALGAPPVPTTTTIVVTPDGIRQLELVYGDPNHDTYLLPFDNWVLDNHPEDADKVGAFDWTSVEEAEQNGLLTAQYAQEWAAFLDAKGCVYPDACYKLP